MFAVVSINGKQEVVRKGNLVKVDRLSAAVDETIEIKEILAVGEGDNLKVGNPYVANSSVKFKVIENKKDKKVIVFKKKRRKRYEVKKGHRQYITILRVEEIIG